MFLYVISGHTASEEGFSQADNVHLIRLIQSYHVESLKWDDIAYNFAIGSDGYIYEGRGWNFKVGINVKLFDILNYHSEFLRITN